MFSTFHFLQPDMAFGILHLFSWIVNAIFKEKSYLLISMPFLLTKIDFKTVKFSRQLNPNWPIQISRAPAVCNENV